jgi:hypothetical protein
MLWVCITPLFFGNPEPFLKGVHGFVLGATHRTMARAFGSGALRYRAIVAVKPPAAAAAAVKPPAAAAAAAAEAVDAPVAEAAAGAARRRAGKKAAGGGGDGADADADARRARDQA